MNASSLTPSKDTSLAQRFPYSGKLVWVSRAKLTEIYNVASMTDIHQYPPAHLHCAWFRNYIELYPGQKCIGVPYLSDVMIDAQSLKEHISRGDIQFGASPDR